MLTIEFCWATDILKHQNECIINPNADFTVYIVNFDEKVTTLK